jgi:DNA-binding IclR family transcriptional regulator
MVRRNDEVLLLDMIDSAQQVKITPLTGQRFTLATTTIGGLFRAFGVPAESDGATPLGAADGLEAIRLRGVCIDEQGFGEGVTCLAVPLLNAKGEIAAVLGLIGPAFRMSRERIEAELVPQLKDAGHVISAGLGYLGHYLRRKTI